MTQPVILSAARTPIGKFLGALSPVSAIDLAATAFKAAIQRAQVSPQEINEVMLGNVVSSGLGMAVARNAALRAGLPETIAAFTVNKVCGSGLQAIMLAAQSIKSGDNNLVLAGGAESMSNAPFILRRARTGLGYGHAKLEDTLLVDGLECCVEGWHMGNAAEHIARKYDVSREDMDKFALESHRKASAAIEGGKFKYEIVPVEIKQKKGPPLLVDRDEGPRADTTLEKLATLKPAFEENGRITAGNASSLNDGAAAVIVSSPTWAEKNNKKPLAKILSYTTAGVAPKDIFHAPALAIPDAVQRAGLQLKDIDLFDINEAFAAQMVANTKVLKLDLAKVNVHGGGVSLGHPIGASGARVLTTLIYALKEYNKRYGCAALCLGGGNAVAMVIERV